MTMTTPPDDFSWATSGTAEVSVPPAATQASGWVAKVRPPHEWVNWAWNLLGRWVSYLALRTKQFTDLGALCRDTAVGDTAELMEDDSASLPGSQRASFSGGATTVDVAADGRFVYVANASTCGQYTRAGVSTGVTYTPTAAGTVVRVVTNGDHVVLAYGTRVECFYASTGVSRWVYNHGATVRDVAIDATRVYLGGNANSGSSDATVRALYIVGGAVNWSHAHGDSTSIIYSVATDGRMVYMAGTASTHASAANLRGVNATNGYDAAGEGSSTDTDGLSWDAVATTNVTSPGCVAVDGRAVYVAYQSATTLEARGRLTGEVVHSVTPPSSIVARRVSVDQDLVIVSSTTASDAVIAFAAGTLSAAWRYTLAGDLVATTDGAAVWVGSGVSNGIAMVARGNRAGRWLRITPTTALGSPFRWLAIPA